MPEPPSGAAPRRARWDAEARARLSTLRLSPAREAAIVDELAQHLEDHYSELIAQGLPPEEAASLALAQFRGGEVLAQQMAPLRQAHAPVPIAPGAPAGHLLADIRQDARYAIRTIAARPGFAIVAILSLALGIGANTALFSLWHGVLHAALPGVANPEGLVMLSNPDRSGSWTGRGDGVRDWLTYEEFEALRDGAGEFSALMAAQSSMNTWTARVDGGGWEPINGRLVSGRFFEVLGAGAAIGRVFTSADDRTTTSTAVISYDYWQRRFAGRTDVLGRTFTARGTTLTIVGVTPRGFIGETAGQQPDVWLPLGMQPALMPGRDRLHDTPPEKSMWLHVFGRLAPHATAAQAEAHANALFQAGLESFYGASASGDRRREFLNQRLQLRSARQGASAARHTFSASLTALLGAAGVLLLIACTNLATLALARGAARGPEIALRLSLGASRGRLVRQLMTESLLLAAIGAAASLAVAAMLYGTLVRTIALSDEDFRMTFAADPLVLFFVLAATFAATLMFGLLPAWQVTRADAGTGLSRHQRGGRAPGRLRSGRVLVGAQLAFSLPLLVGAGLLARTAYNLQRTDLGFPAERLALVRVDLRDAGGGPGGRAARLRELLEAIARIPGVHAVSFSELGVFSGGESSEEIQVEGYSPARDADRESALDVVGPGYVAALGAAIVRGRDILDSDNAGAPPACLVNQAFADKFFVARDPLGARITVLQDGASCRVVGVAANARTQDLRGVVEPRFFIAAAQSPGSATTPTILIRAAAGAPPVTAAVRKTIQSIDAAVPILSATSIEERISPLTAQDRSTAALLVVFGSVALALAAIGLYGVLSYGVAHRTPEIAIRIALGATSRAVTGMILRETSRLVSAGVGIGAILAYASSRVVQSRLYGVDAVDPSTFGVAIALLLVVALTAAYLPARRASRLDPLIALRRG